MVRVGTFGKRHNIGCPSGVDRVLVSSTVIGGVVDAECVVRVELVAGNVYGATVVCCEIFFVSA